MCDRVSKERARGRGPAAARQCVSAGTWLQPCVCVMTAGDVSVCAMRLRDPDGGERDRGREREGEQESSFGSRSEFLSLLHFWGISVDTGSSSWPPRLISVRSSRVFLGCF